MWTPSPSFSTQPVSACARASRNTNGRNPTPCTTPRTLMRLATRLSADAAAASIPALPDDPSVLNEDGNRDVLADQIVKAPARHCIDFDVVLDERDLIPKQMFPHLGGVRATVGAVELGHARHASVMTW